MLNKQTPDKIDWTDYTWNPISGCKHGCDYCYMKRLDKRFNGLMEPKFKFEYLSDLKKIQKPSKIFVGSSGDMFGNWVSRDWIYMVIGACNAFPQHTYQFLTKNTLGYIPYVNSMPFNSLIGTSVDGLPFTENNLEGLKWINTKLRKFISFEPLINFPKKLDLKGIDWVIIGANSNPGSVKPPMEWADEIIGHAYEHNIPVWVKDNYKYHKRIKEFPTEVMPMNQ